MKLSLSSKKFVIFFFTLALNSITHAGMWDPFDIGWLSNNLGLNKSHIEKASFDTSGGEPNFALKFDSADNAEEFYAILFSLEIPAKFWEHSNTVEIPFRSKRKILRATNQSVNNRAPFTMTFFVKYFGLDQDAVKEVKEVASSFGPSYITFIFKSRDNAESFTKKMKKRGTYPDFNWRDNSVTFNDMQEIILVEKGLSPR